MRCVISYVVFLKETVLEGSLVEDLPWKNSLGAKAKGLKMKKIVDEEEQGGERERAEDKRGTRGCTLSATPSCIIARVSMVNIDPSQGYCHEA